MPKEPTPKIFTAKPTECSDQWMVYDMYEDLPPKPIFVGSMEDCGWVADAKNSELLPRRLTPPTP